jgi:ABC-type dipeptide/oligopeptide/nickel transport system permease component
MPAALRRQRWWAGRVAVLPVHMLVFAIGVFFLVRLLPGDPVSQITGGQPMTPAQMDAARKALGLSGSIFDQLKTYLGNILTLDFGRSMITGEPVLKTVATRLPETVELAVMAMFGAVVVTVLGAFLVVLRPRNIFSRLLLPYARAAGAVPDFVLGVAGIFVFYFVLRAVPAPLGLYDPLLTAPRKITSFPVLDALLTGDTTVLASMASHLFLPLIVLVVAYSPLLLKIFIRALEDAVDAPQTRFRIASGASRRTVLLSVGRRAAPSTLAMFGTMFGYMLGGAVVVEQLFAMPGMGQYAVNAVNSADLVALEGFLLVVAAISLVVFLLVDIVNMLVDPRRRPGLATESGS